MRADVVQVRAVRQGVLRDEIDIAPIKLRVTRLLARGNEALAKDHVSRIEAAWISPPEEDGVACHFGVDWLVVLVRVERGSEHVMAEPVAEEVSPLFVFLPMRHNRPDRH